MAERVLVLAPNWLGDAVMALPALAAVRAHAAGGHLAVAARAPVAPLYRMAPGVDEVIMLESRGGLSQVKPWRRDAVRLAAGRFDVALLLPNSFLSAWIVSQAAVPERWGYATDLRGPLLTRRVARTVEPQHIHMAEYYLGLVRALGLPDQPRTAAVRVPDDARARVATLLAEAGLPEGQPYVAMAPGAAYGRAKQWLPERFAELARLLGDERGVATVVVGAGGDRGTGDEIRAALGARTGYVDLIGRTELAELAALLAGARAVVANDSGAMHLAGAVGAQVVAVFGATNEHHTAPLTAGPDAPAPRILTHPVWCRPCMLRECPIDHGCMRGVAARRVLEAVP